MPRVCLFTLLFILPVGNIFAGSSDGLAPIPASKFATERNLTRSSEQANRSVRKGNKAEPLTDDAGELPLELTVTTDDRGNAEGKKEKDSPESTEPMKLVDGSSKSEDDNEEGGTSGKAKGEDAKIMEREGDIKKADDKDGHGSHNKRKTTTKIYDDKGWHTHRDFISRVMRPDELQPFYMMPCFFGSKLFLTMTMLGTSLSFRATRGGCTKYLKKLGKFLATVVFILCALNGYKYDYALFKSDDFDDSFYKQIGAIVIIWVTSTNYVASRAIWGAIVLENPGHILEIKPTYNCFPGTSLPLFPGAATWLDPFKHLYAIILLPYYLPSILVKTTLQCLLCVWMCMSKCLCVLQCLIAPINFWCALIGTIITLFLWPWSKNAVVYWWGFIQPEFYISFIQIWVGYLAPMFFTTAFRWFLSSGDAPPCREEDCFEIYGQGSMSTVPCADIYFVVTAHAPASADAKKYLLTWNQESLQHDFALNQYNITEDAEKGHQDEMSSASKRELIDVRVKIFLLTLLNMTGIVLEQLIGIFIIRVFMSGLSYDDYLGACVLTVTERTGKKYFDHLRISLLAASSKVGNFAEDANIAGAEEYEHLFSQAINAVWEIR